MPSTITFSSSRTMSRSTLQHANSASQPFAFLPKRKVAGTGPSTSQSQILLIEEPESLDLAIPPAPPRHARHAKPALHLDLPPTLIVPPPRPTSAQATFVRKKSGELVKPSLKSSSSYLRQRTKSAPATPSAEPRPLPPTPKSVHFDTQLEYVKFFLAEQKPKAVSRAGSPSAYETSEGDTTDTGYPFPPAHPQPSPTMIRLKPIALPAPLVPGVPWTFDVRLEAVSLDTTSQNGCPVDSASPSLCLTGAVLVRNIAFSKLVFIRFTLDGWETTSEVAAKYQCSLKDGAYDRFEFRVGLGDYAVFGSAGRGGKSEGRKMLFCVRYTLPGLTPALPEMWDSNGGRNYELGFERVDIPNTTANANANASRKRVRAPVPFTAFDDSDSSPVPTPLLAPSPGPSPLAQTTAHSLAARYDFGKAWRASPMSSPLQNTGNTHATDAHGRDRLRRITIPVQPMMWNKGMRTRGSPREAEIHDVEEAIHAPEREKRNHTRGFESQSPSPSNIVSPRTRQRRTSYFDSMTTGAGSVSPGGTSSIAFPSPPTSVSTGEEITSPMMTSKVKMTPPGTPVSVQRVLSGVVSESSSSSGSDSADSASLSRAATPTPSDPHPQPPQESNLSRTSSTDSTTSTSSTTEFNTPAYASPTSPSNFFSLSSSIMFSPPTSETETDTEEGDEEGEMKTPSLLTSFASTPSLMSPVGEEPEMGFSSFDGSGGMGPEFSSFGVGGGAGFSSFSPTSKNGGGIGGRSVPYDIDAMGGMGVGMDMDTKSERYWSLLDQFCFFTGVNTYGYGTRAQGGAALPNAQLHLHAQGHTRSHSYPSPSLPSHMNMSSYSPPAQGSPYEYDSPGYGYSNSDSSPGDMMSGMGMGRRKVEDYLSVKLVGVSR
ncbi:carbohydrate-binding module family 21 protein [Sphaerobolus stellatus SS14]|nr:carbohydrate-binding module family 21 protein [Sphaerobolus stellatus SS14]